MDRELKYRLFVLKSNLAFVQNLIDDANDRGDFDDVDLEHLDLAHLVIDGCISQIHKERERISGEVTKRQNKYFGK